LKFHKIGKRKAAESPPFPGLSAHLAHERVRLSPSPTPPLSLSTGLVLSARPRPRPRAPPLSRCRVGPACHPSPFNRPAISRSSALAHVSRKPASPPHVPGPRRLTLFPPPRTLWPHSTPPVRSLALSRPCPSSVVPRRDELRHARASARFRLVWYHHCIHARNMPTSRTPPRLSSARGEDHRRPFFCSIPVSLSVIAQFAGEGRRRCFAVMPWSPANRQHPRAAIGRDQQSVLCFAPGKTWTPTSGTHWQSPALTSPLSLLCATN
jgi:hypothetical protein